MEQDIIDMIDALRRAGWTIGVTAFVQCGSRLSWTVSGINGQNRIVADGSTEVEAWRAACEQAAGVRDAGAAADNMGPP